MKSESVSIVIPTWNGLWLLKQTLDKLILNLNNSHIDYEIIIVDNGSMDRTVDVIKDYYPSINIIGLETNTGFGNACNLGASKSKFDKIFFLNNDIILDVDCLKILIQEFNKIENIFSISPQTNYWDDDLSDKVFCSAINFNVNKNGELIQQWAVKDYQNKLNGNQATIYGTGAALLVDKNKFMKINGFSEIYGLAYWEDVDLCLKAWSQQWGSYCTDKTKIWHKISATSNSEDMNKSNFKNILMLRNYLIFQFIYLDLKDFLKFSKYIFKNFKILNKNEIFKKSFVNLPYMQILKHKRTYKKIKLNKLIQQLPNFSEYYNSSATLERMLN